MNQALLDELFDFLRIPSISSGAGDPAELGRAALWVCTKVRAAGGTARVVETEGYPLAVGRLSAASENAPTVLVYGHYDVQGPEPLDLWRTDPFEPTLVDGRVYARGASDDKGNFFPLLYVACELATTGELPINVEIVAEGEEEIGSPSIALWIENELPAVDCAVVFDSTMLDPSTPAITLGVRGVVVVDVRVRSATRDLHSGLYGGSALNAVHALHAILDEVLPDGDGRVRPELREGIVDPTLDELAAWVKLPSGDTVLADVGARSISERSGADYYTRNWADASLDLNGIVGGEPYQTRTIIPAEARARLSLRLAPDQDADRMGDVLKQLLVDAAPPRVEVDVQLLASSNPALFDPTSAPMKLAAAALERAVGTAPVFTRVGGSLPILAALAQKDIPTILSGFALADDAFHAPNESFRLESLELGERAARELYAAFAELTR